MILYILSEVPDGFGFIQPSDSVFSFTDFLTFSMSSSAFWSVIFDSNTRHVPKSKNLGGHTVMRRAAACRRRLLICQNLGGHVPPCPPLAHACISHDFIIYQKKIYGKFNFQFAVPRAATIQASDDGTLWALGTIYLRRRQIFIGFDPYPPTVGKFGKFFTPPP